MTTTQTAAKPADHTPELLAALRQIEHCARPGQTVTFREAVELLTEIYTTARTAIATESQAA